MRYVTHVKWKITWAKPLEITRHESFSKKIESIQYKESIAITGAIESPSCEKLCHELGLEIFYQRRCTRRL